MANCPMCMSSVRLFVLVGGAQGTIPTSGQARLMVAVTGWNAWIGVVKVVQVASRVAAAQ